MANLLQFLDIDLQSSSSPYDPMKLAAMLEKQQECPVSKLVLVWIAVCTALLLLLSFATQLVVAAFGLPAADDPRLLYQAFEHLVDFLDTRNEANLPTWFSSSLLLVVAFLASLIGLLSFRHGLPWRVHWLGIGLLFLLLSLDESASLHERLIMPLSMLLGTSGFLRYAWVIPGAIAVLVLSAIYLRFVMALPSAVRLKVMASAAIFLGGALGMEMAAGYYHERFNNTDLVWTLMSTIEEGMEMFGVGLFIHALLYHLEATFSWATSVRTMPLAAKTSHADDRGVQRLGQLSRRKRAAQAPSRSSLPPG